MTAATATGAPATTLRILGIDPSLTGTGLAYADGTTATVATRAADGDRRLVQIANAVRACVDGVQLAVMEDLPKHAMAAGLTGRVQGVVRLVLLEAGVPYVTVVPATLKKYATGKGVGDKTPMVMAAYKRFGLEFPDDNQCDAFWLRAMGLDAYHEPLAELPAVQRDAMTKVDWPLGLGVRS